MNIRDFANYRFWKNYVKQAYTAAIEVALNLTDEEIRVTSKATFTKLTNYLESALEKLYTVEKVGKILEVFELELAIRFLRCPYL